MYIGLTGNIATGKSAAFRVLTNTENLVGFDADKVVHALYGRSDVVDELVSTFGSGIISKDMTVSRAKIREIFLVDTSARGKLESIFHPKVYQEYLKVVRALSEGQHLVADIPLLFEAESPYQFDKVITVACSADIQLDRLMSRSSLDKETALAMIGKQVEMSYKMRRSDFVLWNNGDLGLLQRQIKLLIEQIF